MRVWFKAWLERPHKEISNSLGKIIDAPKDQSFTDHATAIGGYDPTAAYQSKEDFFRTYFTGRYVFWHEFLEKHLKATENILSIASGRCINESHFLLKGFQITCSDLEIIPSYEQAKNLFGSFRYLALDITQQRLHEKFDTIFALSLIYIFDENQFERFLKNSYLMLEDRGHLLVDSAGSNDGLISLIWDYYLWWECRAIYFLMIILKRPCNLYLKRHYGFKRSDLDIIEAARSQGFIFCEQQDFDFETELNRSQIYSRLSKRIPFLKLLFRPIGRRIPYIRMFKFQKTN